SGDGRITLLILEAATMVSPSDHPSDVRPGEVFALEQETLAGCASQGVGEDVAEVEAGGVTSLSEAPVRQPCFGDVLRVHRDHHDFGLLINVSSSRPPASPFRASLTR